MFSCGVDKFLQGSLSISQAKLAFTATSKWRQTQTLVGTSLVKVSDFTVRPL
jgi:hypothetical protein